MTMHAGPFLSLSQLVLFEFVPREFLTGFHKRKVAKAEAGKKKALERQKQDRLEVRREVRLLM